MPEPQSYSHHARVDPPFHYVLLPVLLFNLFFSISSTIHNWPFHRELFLWWIVMSVALIVLAGRSRSSALRAQDRIIRLEERLRLAALLPASDLHGTQSLTEAQFIALRFASDAELPSLVRRTLSEHLTPKQIKQAITTWRPDNYRV
ncbi:MAG: hypothetical protein NVSMB3_02130 [Acidobacteriaceae bacterium]